MSGENSQGWITEEAFFTVSPGARQVRQRKEVKMNQLSPAERHEFLKSMEVEWQTLLQNQPVKVLSLEETAQAQARWPDRAIDTRWAPGRRAKARLIIKGFKDPDLLDIESHSPTLTREGFLTVLQSVCSHGHKLQFGDVQQALNTGLASARGLGFETSVLELCVLVLRGSQQRYHGIVGVAVDVFAGGGDDVWEHAISKLKQRFTFGHWEVGTGNFAVVRWCRQQMDPCVLDSLLTSTAWTLCLLGN